MTTTSSNVVEQQRSGLDVFARSIGVAVAGGVAIGILSFLALAVLLSGDDIAHLPATLGIGFVILGAVYGGAAGIVLGLIGGAINALVFSFTIWKPKLIIRLLAGVEACGFMSLTTSIALEEVFSRLALTANAGATALALLLAPWVGVRKVEAQPIDWSAPRVVG